LLAALGGLWCAGRLVDWSRLFPADAPWCRLPFYPWQRERHWAEEAEIAPSSLRESAVSPKPNDESLGWLHRLEWRARDVTPGARPPGQSDAGCLVIGASDADASAMAAALAAEGVPTQTASLHDLAGGVAKALLTDAGAPRTIVVLAPENVDAPYLPLRTLQAVLGVAASRRPQLWFVTRGSQAVASARAHRIAVDSAALWGAARVVAEEHPELWGGLVDMDPLAPPSSDFALLARHMLAADGEDQVAFRGGHRFVLRLTTTQQRERAAPYAWRADSTYLVTGGLGDVGLRVAEAMVRSGVRRLILLGRTALPAREDWTNLDPSSVPGRRVAAVRSLEAQGVAVHTAAVDVGDEAQLNAFLAQFTAEAWPPIRGIVHTAGTLDNHLAGTMSRGTFDALVRTKLGGARLLDRLLPDVELFVMFSSTGALLAQPGQANYAAANAGLDALAHDRRARGIPANSIEWGVWEQTGLVVGEAGERGVAELARQGVRAFSPESGVALFRWLGGGSEAVPVVLPIDWSVFRRARAGREFPVFRECMAGAGGGATGEFDLRQQLERSSYGERRQLLDTAVREHVGRVLKIAPARLDSRRALGSLGLNSLMAMELRNRLEAALGRSLSATLAWNYPTIEALAAYLAGAPDSAAQAAPATSSPAQGDLASRLSHVADLTDDDAVLALRARRPPPGS
jgi:acyl carrier protein